MNLSAAMLSKNYQRILRALTTSVIVLLPAAVFGQGYFGTVSGVLTDPSAAIIQGASHPCRRAEGIRIYHQIGQRRAVPVCFNPARIVFRDGGDAGL